MRVVEFDANGPWSDDNDSIFTTVPREYLEFNPIQVGDRVIATQEGEGWWATVVAVRDLGLRDHVGVYLRTDYMDAPRVIPEMERLRNVEPFPFKDGER